MDGLYPFKELHCHVAERNDGVLVQFKLIAVAKVVAAFGTDELARLQLLVGDALDVPLADDDEIGIDPWVILR